MSPIRWIKEQLRISDVSTLDTDFVLVGSRIFAVQLRVLSLLTGTSTLAVLLLLRSALGISPDSYVFEIIVRAWSALFFLVMTFSALGELLARASFHCDDFRWIGRFLFGVIGAFAVSMCLLLDGAASEAAMLVAIATMSIFGARETEPILFSDVSNDEEWTDKLLTEEGFRRRWSPLFCTLVMLLPLALPSGSLMGAFAPMILGPLLFFLLLRFSWEVCYVVHPVDRRQVWSRVKTSHLTDNYNANLSSFAARCVKAVLITVCAAALLLLAAGLGAWIIS